jgi:hypothetical protein
MVSTSGESDTVGFTPTKNAKKKKILRDFKMKGEISSL